MNISSFIPPWAWATLVVANCLMAGASILSGYSDMFFLNLLSAAGCLVGYIQSSNLNKDDK